MSSAMGKAVTGITIQAGFHHGHCMSTNAHLTSGVTCEACETPCHDSAGAAVGRTVWLANGCRAQCSATAGKL